MRRLAAADDESAETLKLKKIKTELARGMDLTRTGGLSAGLRFGYEEILRNTWLRAAALVVSADGAAVQCNVCGWSGRRFLSHCAVAYVDRNSFCPRCRSYPRHRGFAWLWKERVGAELAHLKGAPGLKLAFAPERGMLDLLEPQLGKIEGADLDPSNKLVRYQEDLQHLTFADGSVDFISCFHVLEHVTDDRRALRELWRVLSKEGRMILCVPITVGRAETWDFGGPNALLNGHCFDYGEDFPERLMEAGFSGGSFQIDELVPEVLHRRLALTKESFFVLRRARPGEEARIEPKRTAAAEPAGVGAVSEKRYRSRALGARRG